jgi:hypothetical protein
VIDVMNCCRTPDERLRATAARFSDLRGSISVSLEFGYLVEALFQTLQQFAVEWFLGGRQGIMAPKARFANHDQLGLPKIGQMTRNARLGNSKALDDVAHAEFSTPQDVQNPQSCSVRERSKHQVNCVLSVGLRDLRHARNGGTAAGTV